MICRGIHDNRIVLWGSCLTNCIVCDDEIYNLQIPGDVVCSRCSERHELCEVCGEIIDDKDSMKKIEIGDMLTIMNNCYTWAGNTLFFKGQMVTVRKVNIREGYWSSLCPDIYYEDKITSVQLEEATGIYTLEIFEEYEND